MLSEQLDLFGDRPKSPRPPAQVKLAPEPAQEKERDDKTAKVERALAAVIMPDTAPDDNPVLTTTLPAEIEQEANEEAPDSEAGQDEANEAVPEIMDMELPVPAMADRDLKETTSAVIVELPEAEAPEPAMIVSEASEDEVDEVAMADTAADEEEPANETTEATSPHIDWSHGELNIPPDHQLFQRQYYTMRETTNMFGLTHAQLRSWENEFDVLQPRKNRKGDRYFRPVDIKNLELIYHLLRKRKFTPDGAKAYLKNNKNALDNFALIQKLEGIKAFLHELKANL